MSKFAALSEKHSATCFLNSLLREWNGYEIVNSNLETKVMIPVKDGAAIELPLAKYSSLGRHEYTGFYLIHKNRERYAIEFSQLVNLLSEFLAEEFQTDAQALENFKSRVFASQKTILKTLEKRSDEFGSFSLASWNFKNAEQALVIGHNFHPNPKSRDEFNEEDMNLYSPEWGGHFRLQWLVVRCNVLLQKKSKSFADDLWTNKLMNQEGLELGGAFDSREFIAVPMHPWQWAILKKQTLFQNYLQQNSIIELGTGHKEWYPTSSLRSVYCESAPYMLKFSMSVKLTNSIRHLLPREVERGLQLADVLATPKGQEFLSLHPYFHIVIEPAYLCFRDEDGSPVAESLIVARENPFSSFEKAQGKILLATLTQADPLGGRNLIHKLLEQDHSDLPAKAKVKKWFNQYLHVTVKPILLAHANYGIILGAHQQNLILDFDGAYPKAAYFRDCQGTGYSQLGYELFANQVSSISLENGNVVSEKMGHYLFAYYLILNSSFNVITALTQDSPLSEDELLKDFKDFLIDLQSTELRDSSFIKYLLNEDRLMHKGNFICSFKSINENTAVDPLAIYTPVQNPLKAHHLKEVHAQAH